MIVSVCIRDARDVEDANAQCKRSQAYRQICTKHPPNAWKRRYVRTYLDERTKCWFIDFDVERLEVASK